MKMLKVIAVALFCLLADGAILVSVVDTWRAILQNIGFGESLSLLMTLAPAVLALGYLRTRAKTWEIVRVIGDCSYATTMMWLAKTFGAGVEAIVLVGVATMLYLAYRDRIRSHLQSQPAVVVEGDVQ